MRCLINGVGRDRSRLWDVYKWGLGHEYGTDLRSRLWDREDSFMGQDWDDIKQRLANRKGHVCGTVLRRGGL